MKNLNLHQQIILLAGMFFVLMIIVAFFHEDGILTIYEFENELVQFKGSNKKLENQNQKLRYEIDALKSNPFAIEILAREKLSMVRPGETVYQLVLQEQSTVLPTKE